jgi:putative membrane protein
MPHLTVLRVRILFALLASALSLPAFAHAPPADGGSSPGWVMVALLVAALWYSLGVRRLWPHTRARRVLAWRAAAFGAGWLALTAALLAPLDEAAQRSFAFHMIQHEVLMLIAAPLLVIGRGLPTFLWALPAAARRVAGRATKRSWLKRSWSALTAPLSAWLLHAAALWLWHLPAFFNAAVVNATIHDWQHSTFLATALVFWHALLRHGAHGARGMALLYLFTTTIHTGVLGAMLTFAPRPFYRTLDPGLFDATGLTPLEDQQLGGLIMWVPGALVYVSVALVLAARWLRALDTSSEAARPM